MKTAILLLSLTLGSSAFALEMSPSEFATLTSTAITLAPFAATKDISDATSVKAANKAIEDIQTANQTGELSIALSQAVRNLQVEDESLSVQEALDKIIERAESILNSAN